MKRAGKLGKFPAMPQSGLVILILEIEKNILWVLKFYFSTL